MSQQQKKKELSKKAAERVAIAKDVISQIRAKRLIAMSGTYLSAADNNWLTQFGVYDEDMTDLDEESKNQQVVPPTKCNVCALGAVFVSALDRNDRLKVGDFAPYPGQDDLHNYLKRWFTLNQLYLMEEAFEGYSRPEYCGTDAEFFGSRYDNDEDRMLAIMRNIVKNDGTFVPPKPQKKQLKAWNEYNEQY